MRAAKLNKRVEIQAFTTTKSATSGFEDETWTTVFTQWMGIEPVDGSERWLGNQLHAETSHLVHARWCAEVDVTPANRLRWVDGHGVEHLYEIKSVVNVRQQNRWLRIGAREVV